MNYLFNYKMHHRQTCVWMVKQEENGRIFWSFPGRHMEIGKTPHLGFQESPNHPDDYTNEKE